MSKPQRLPDTGEDHDKVLEAKMAELINSTSDWAELQKLESQQNGTKLVQPISRPT